MKKLIEIYKLDEANFDWSKFKDPKGKHTTKQRPQSQGLSMKDFGADDPNSGKDPSKGLSLGKSGPYNANEFKKRAPRVAALLDSEGFDDLEYDMFIWVENDNGSWEGWPNDDAPIGGVLLIDKEGKEASNSDYAEDWELDRVSGINNWRDESDVTAKEIGMI